MEYTVKSKSLQLPRQIHSGRTEDSLEKLNDPEKRPPTGTKQ